MPPNHIFCCAHVAKTMFKAAWPAASPGLKKWGGPTALKKLTTFFFGSRAFFLTLVARYASASQFSLFIDTYNLLNRNYVQLSQRVTALLSKGMILSIPYTFVSSVSTVETVRQAPPPPHKKLNRFARISGPIQKKVGGSGPAWTHCWRRRCAWLSRCIVWSLGGACGYKLSVCAISRQYCVG